MARPKSTVPKEPSTATIGFEATALHDSAFPPPKAILRSLSAAKNNMVALPGQLFYSTQIPVCLRFCGKNNTLDLANDVHVFADETELSLVA